MLPVLLVAGGLLSYTSVKLYNNFNKGKKLSLPKNKTALANTRPLKKVRGRSVLTYQDAHDKKEKKLNTDYQVASGALGLTVLALWTTPLFILPAVGAFAYITLPIWKEAKNALKHRKINIDVVYAIALPALILSGYYVIGALNYWLYVWSQRLLFQAENNAQQSLIKELIQLPENTWIIHEGISLEIAVKNLQQGDIVIVRSGDILPADGTIIKGTASINPYMTTDDPTLLERKVGERVLASDILVSGELHISVEETGNQTIIANISRYMGRSSDMSNLVQLRGEAIADGFATPTLALGGLALPFAGIAGGLAILQSCIGEAIRLIIPLTTLKFLRNASQHELWIKDGRALERLTRVDTVVFDINSLLVLEYPEIKTIHCFSQFNENQLLQYTGALAQHRSNPVAQTVMQLVLARELVLPETFALKAQLHGTKGRINEQWVYVGTLDFIREQGIYLNKKQRNLIHHCRKTGYPILLIAIDKKVVGLLELRYALRPEARSMIKKLNQTGMNTYLVSSEPQQPVETIATELGIRSWQANKNAQQCVNFIQELQQQRKVVCFIGNHVDSLKTADVAVVSRGFSIPAMNTAHIVLLDNNPAHLNDLFAITQELKAKLKTGLTTAILPGVGIILSVFLFNLGVIGSFVIYYGSPAIGIAHAKSTVLDKPIQEKTSFPVSK